MVAVTVIDTTTWIVNVRDVWPVNDTWAVIVVSLLLLAIFSLVLPLAFVVSGHYVQLIDTL